MKLSAILAPLIAAKADHATIMQVVVAFETEQNDALEKRRESDRKRQSDKRSRDITLRHSDRLLTGAKKSSSLEVIGSKEGRKKERSPSAASDLEAFKTELAPILDPERLDALVAVRRKKGATFSAHAGRLLSKALLACPNVAAAADEMVVRNWTGIKPDWLESRAHRSTSPPNRKPTPFDALEQISREKGWIPDEPEQLRRSNGDAQRLPAERSGHQGAVVDLRPGAFRRVR